MNIYIKKTFLLEGDKFMPEIHFRYPVFIYIVYGSFWKTKNECKNLSQKEIQNIFMKMNKVKPVFSNIWLKVTLKIQRDDLCLIKYCVLKHLMMQITSNMMDISKSCFNGLH